MNKKLVTLISVLAFAVFIALAYFAYGALTKDRTAPDETNNQDQDRAADFTVYDDAGKEVKLSDFKGRPVVLNFWASWCSPCRSEMGDFNEVYLSEKDHVVFMMVNLTDGQRETKKTAKAYIDETDYRFPVYFDLDSDAAVRYSVTSIPTTYFIDAEGHIVKINKGAMTKRALISAINSIK